LIVEVMKSAYGLDCTQDEVNLLA
jgi:hypothetical protein